MSVDLLHYPSHDHFFVNKNDHGEPELLRAKEALFMRAGPNEAIAIADFDKTLTTNGPKDLTSWDVATPFLKEGPRQRIDERYHHYGRLEEEGLLTPEDADKWWEGDLEDYRESEVRLDQVRGNAITKIKFREGVPEFFNFCSDQEIPVAIVSAGLKFVIEAVSRYNYIRPEYIISTDIKTDDPEGSPKNGPIKSWENVVHNHNKAERSHEQLCGALALRPNVVLLGDSLEDPKMVADVDPATGEQRNVIRVRIGDHYKAQRSVDSYIKKSFDAGYDIVTLGGMSRVHEYVEHLVTQ
jgi:phosphoserine phosphatase